ncbi:type I DNA topoisomerase [Mollicutes bacterium LVI A0039]|nr:type I DNA topoisomerase [Mollicutes bacterium LVI A0039]
MQKLVIVESPAKAKTIEKYLGEDFKVLSSVGHVRDLATTGPGGLGVDVEDAFQASYKYITGKKKIVTELKKEAAKSEFVYLATDPDREGEAISWHLADELGLDVNELNRVVFNEITKSGVETGMEHIRSIDMDLVNSQESRRIIDRILGFKLSKLLQQKIKEKSAGRVQSVALRIICEREEEIDAFVPLEYYKILAIVGELELDYIANDKKISKEEALAIYETLNDKTLNVSDKKITNKKQNPYLPFTTSTFQQTAVNKLGYTSRRAMSVAQKLYEGVEISGEMQGLITYMRTDSTRLSPDFSKYAMGYIKGTFGEEYVGFVRKTKADSNSQDAHEAIRPTSVNLTPAVVKPYLSQEQYKIYSLIYNRAVSSLMAPAKMETSTYIFTSTSGVEFKASSTVTKFDGYKKVYNADSVDKPELEFTVGETVTVDEFECNQHFTKPPARYSEAKLIKEMEEKGIGRPSTYAATIDVIKARNYVTYENKQFIPTDSGKLVTTKLKEFFIDFIDVDYTRNLENELDLVANGDEDKVELLSKFMLDFEPLLEKAQADMEKIEAVKTGNSCPNCGSDMVMRKGRFGEFEACSNFPTCKYIVQEEKEILGDCPKCEDGKVVEKVTRRGKPFYGCDKFPKCDYAVWNKEDIGKIIEQPVKKKATKKKTTAKKTTAKKTTAKKTTAKKTTAKKTTAKKTTAKKTTKKTEE